MADVLVHALPTTTQGLNGCLTACEIKSHWEHVSPIVQCSRDLEKITCRLCAVAEKNRRSIAQHSAE